MGYRSQVAIAIGDEHLDYFKSEIEEDDLEGAEVVEVDDRTIFMFDCVKWYNSFADVKRICAANCDPGIAAASKSSSPFSIHFGD